MYRLGPHNLEACGVQGLLGVASRVLFCHPNNIVGFLAMTSIEPNGTGLVGSVGITFCWPHLVTTYDQRPLNSYTGDPLP